VRLRAASDLSDPAIQQWHHVVEVRREWLRHGLCTEPADRDAAERGIAGIYARLRRVRPRFVWVESPYAALGLLDGLPTHNDLYRWIVGRHPGGRPPLASDLAAVRSRLRTALDECLPAPDPPKKLKRAKGEPWPELPPAEAFAAGVPFREVVRQGVAAALATSLGFTAALYATLGTWGTVPVCWYGQQESHWIAYYDAWQRLELAKYPAADRAYLDDWATVARSAGWWWPGEDRCVVVERPAVIRTEPVAEAWHEQVRAVEVRYRDGRCWRAGAR
jgi:hypothetical protein